MHWALKNELFSENTTTGKNAYQIQTLGKLWIEESDHEQQRKNATKMGVDWHELFFRQGFENSPKFNATQALFQEFGWVKFIDKFEGFNDHMSLAFARGLKDWRVQVGDLVMEVSEKIIARATALSTDRERWSKNKTITIEKW